MRNFETAVTTTRRRYSGCQSEKVLSSPSPGVSGHVAS